MQLMVKVLNGIYIDDLWVIYVKVKDVMVKFFDLNDWLMINLDGEYGGDVLMEFYNLYQYMMVVVNMEVILDDVIISDIMLDM